MVGSNPCWRQICILAKKIKETVSVFFVINERAVGSPNLTHLPSSKALPEQVSLNVRSKNVKKMPVFVCTMLATPVPLITEVKQDWLALNLDARSDGVAAMGLYYKSA